MPGGEGFAVSPSDLRAHAGRVDAIAAELGTARQAGQAVRVDGQAYGQLCTLVPALIGALDEVVTGAIGEAGTSVQDTAVRLRRTADTYQSADEDNRASFDRLAVPR